MLTGRLGRQADVTSAPLSRCAGRHCAPSTPSLPPARRVIVKAAAAERPEPHFYLSRLSVQGRAAAAAPADLSPPRPPPVIAGWQFN